MEVPARADGFREHDAAGVDGLEDAFNVRPPRDFLDQKRREALGTQLFVDAEEVDLGAFERFGADAEGHGDAGDEGDEFAGFGGADADVPLFAPAGGFECPEFALAFHTVGFTAGEERCTSSRRKRSS